MNRALISALASTIALAAVSAPALASDPRLVERLYDPAKVVRIEGRTKVQATIAFAEDEHIENVAIGDSTAWQVTPNKRANLLFVKPLSPTARTNMTVVTDRHTYLFDLVASPRANPLYVLRFTYPKEPEGEQPARQAAVTPQAPNAVETAAASDPYAVVDPAELNFAWAGTGDRALLPARTYDDGNATFLQWHSGEPVPAILVTDYKGVEGPVNFTVRGDVIVVEGVPREIILRSGEDSATLVNSGPERTPRPLRNEAALARSENLPAGENN
ncbi:type VI secretion protein [Altererythrobacter sp. FM1]|uniref:TrbG/VirB9 family P-type conjugative transfer protein n=1 Tax=Tsuneonella flava TaxID=2055955 RepID=UPI000C800BAD|nr:TrbG/VirB9 family P-type conjugative transfer protein [Tsuneonella flava]ROT94001.1 type VI secretion protein [Altererythrobacter sp. FM1]